MKSESFTLEITVLATDVGTNTRSENSANICSKYTIVSVVKTLSFHLYHQCKSVERLFLSTCACVQLVLVSATLVTLVDSSCPRVMLTYLDAPEMTHVAISHSLAR